jgi:hypothetical protein
VPGLRHQDLTIRRLDKIVYDRRVICTTSEGDEADMGCS